MRQCKLCGDLRNETDFERSTIHQCKACRHRLKKEWRAKRIASGWKWDPTEEQKRIYKSRNLARQRKRQGWDIEAFFSILHAHPKEWSKWVLSQGPKCAQCGNPIFVSFSAGRRFCSKQCAALAGTLPQRQCDHCGCSFQPGYASKKYCSRGCSKRDDQAIAESRRLRKTCRICGCEFTVKPDRVSAKYCGDKCRSQGLRKPINLAKMRLETRKKMIRQKICRQAKSGHPESHCELCGCTVAELRAHLESKFKPGMSWENHRRDGWHIDHIVPLSAYDLYNPIHMAICCHFTNLQPLWAAENMSKGGVRRGLTN